MLMCYDYAIQDYSDVIIFKKIHQYQITMPPIFVIREAYLTIENQERQGFIFDIDGHAVEINLFHTVSSFRVNGQYAFH